MRHTKERLDEILTYSPEEGALKWKVGRSRLAIAGSAAGSITSCGYISLMVDGVRIFAHRAAWLMHYGVAPNGVVDHIDRDRTNNRINNLRVVSKSINSLNSSSAKGTLPRGVRRDGSKFTARVIVDGTSHAPPVDPERVLRMTPPAIVAFWCEGNIPAGVADSEGGEA
jgi:hypothetical protein